MTTGMRPTREWIRRRREQKGLLALALVVVVACSLALGYAAANLRNGGGERNPYAAQAANERDQACIKDWLIKHRYARYSDFWYSSDSYHPDPAPAAAMAQAWDACH
jgi:hypothetical protein